MRAAAGPHLWNFARRETAVFAIGHDFGLEAAADLADMGMKIAAVADCREDGQNPDAVERLFKRKIPLPAGLDPPKRQKDAHG